MPRNKSRLAQGLWSNRDFMRLWTAQTISRFGSHVGSAGIAYAALLTLNATPGQMGLLGSLQSLPVLAIGPIAGAYVDRVRKRPVLVFADIARAAVLCVVPIAAWLGVLSMPPLYVIAALMGSLEVLSVVADPAYLPALLPKVQLAEGNGKMAVSTSVAEIAGPPLAGSMVQALSAPVAVLLDAVTYIVSAVLLGRIRVVEPPPVVREASTIWRDVVEGMRIVWTHPILRFVAASAAMAQFFGTFYMVLYALYMLRVLHLTPAEVGLGIGLGGVGAVAGSLIAGRVVNRIGLGRCLLLATVGGVCAQPFFLLVHAPGAWVLPLSIVMQVVGDVVWTHYDVAEVTIRQMAAPPGALGRVNASMHVMTRGMTPAAALLAGHLATRHGPTAVLSIAWCGILVSAVPLLTKAVRSFRCAGEVG